jgi:AraC family L-rhamnose operon regulatory protein RhaS
MSVIVEAGRWTPSKRRYLLEHRNAGLEVVHVVAGRTRWKIGRREFDLRPGDAFYTLPWEVHGSVRAREPGLVIDFVVLRLGRNYARPRDTFAFHPSLGWSARESRRLSRALARRRSRAMPAGPRLPWLLDQLVGLGPGRSDGPLPLTRSLVGATLAELARLADASPARRRSTDPVDASAALRVAAFLDGLPGVCDRPWTLASMAAACGVGRTRFGQLVREQTGDTPILALNRARIARAERLLRDTDRPITRIAHECGFSSSQYFARLFREYVGEPASAYRRAAASPL